MSKYLIYEIDFIVSLTISLFFQPQKPIVLRKRRQRIKSESNWDLFYY